MNKNRVALFNSDQVMQTLLKKGLGKAECAHYVASALRAIAGDQKLAACSDKSILESLAICAELKLPPEKSLGYIYFVPYKGVCQVILGAKGMKVMMFKNNSVRQLTAHVVREGDVLEYWECGANGMHYKFKPCLFAEKRDDNIRGAIAFLETSNPDGTKRQHFVHMSKAEIDKIKEDSRGQMWIKHYDEMAKKTVIRRLYKEAPTVKVDFDLESSLSREDTLNEMQDVTESSPQQEIEVLPQEDVTESLNKELEEIEV